MCLGGFDTGILKDWFVNRTHFKLFVKIKGELFVPMKKLKCNISNSV